MRPRLRVVYSPKLGCFGVRNLDIDPLFPVYIFQNGEQWVVIRGKAERRISSSELRMYHIDKSHKQFLVSLGNKLVTI